MAWPRRKPSSLHALALLDKLQYGPQAAEAHNTKDDTPDADSEQRTGNTTHSEQKKKPPAANAKIILGLDDQWVKGTDGEEGGSTDYDSRDLHVFLLIQ